MSTTFPTLGTLMKSLNTRWGAMNGPDVTQYALESISRSRDVGGGTKTGQARLRHSDISSSQPKLRPDPSQYTFRVRSPSPQNSPARRSDDSDQMIIKKTVSIGVERS